MMCVFYQIFFYLMEFSFLTFLFTVLLPNNNFVAESLIHAMTSSSKLLTSFSNSWTDFLTSLIYLFVFSLRSLVGFMGFLLNYSPGSWTVSVHLNLVVELWSFGWLSCLTFPCLVGFSITTCIGLATSSSCICGHSRAWSPVPLGRREQTVATSGHQILQDITLGLKST